jgi:hypothetical protein
MSREFPAGKGGGGLNFRAHRRRSLVDRAGTNPTERYFHASTADYVNLVVRLVTDRVHR